MKDRRAKSPYVKYDKTPYRYSDHYRHWKTAVRENKAPEEVARLAALHAAAFGYRRDGFEPTKETGEQDDV